MKNALKTFSRLLAIHLHTKYMRNIEALTYLLTKCIHIKFIIRKSGTEKTAFILFYGCACLACMLIGMGERNAKETPSGCDELKTYTTDNFQPHLTLIFVFFLLLFCVDGNMQTFLMDKS